MSFANTTESQELTNDSEARGYGAPNISKAQHNRSSSKKVIPNQRVKFFLEGHGSVQVKLEFPTFDLLDLCVSELFRASGMLASRVV